MDTVTTRSFGATHRRPSLSRVLTLSVLALFPVQARGELAVDMRLSPDPVRPGAGGSQLDVRLTVTNLGTSLLSEVSLEVPLPEELLTVARLGILGGTCDSINGNVNNCNHPERVIFDIGELPPGAGRTVGFAVFVSDLPDGSILNLEAFAAAGSQQAVVERGVAIRSAPAFELSLSADREPVAPGEEITYTIAWGHVATGRLAPAARLQLELPAGANYLSSTGGGTHSSGLVQWNLGDLQPGDSGEERVTLSVDSESPGGTLLSARAEIRDQDSTPRTARDHAVTRLQADTPLSVTFDVRPSTVDRGETMDIDMSVTNHGGVVIPGAVLEVPLPERIATLNRLGLEGGTCTSVIGNVNNCNFPERVVFDLGELESGETRTVGFSPQVLGSAPQAPDGSLIRVRAFVRGASHQAVAATAVRVGEVSVPPAGRFVRGDSNADGRFDIVDPIFTLGYLFSGTATPGCLDASDANDNSTVEISDPILSLNYLFGNGPPPASPAGPVPEACGVDPTPDGLDCAAYAPCASG